MTYVISDIHGCYTQFKELLEKIDFNDNDIMYVLGDIVDYGEEPMELICDLSVRYNIYPVAGEHDYTAVRMLMGFEKMLKSGAGPDKNYIREMNIWIENGGKKTFEGYRKLDDEMKEGVLEYLSDMPLYEEVKVGNTEYVLVHSGIGDIAENGECNCTPSGFFDYPVDFSARPLKDRTVIAGHIPTSQIKDGKTNRIYKGDGVIGMDCGAARGGCLGCLRLEDGAEFYV